MSGLGLKKILCVTLKTQFFFLGPTCIESPSLLGYITSIVIMTSSFTKQPPIKVPIKVVHNNIDSKFFLKNRIGYMDISVLSSKIDFHLTTLTLIK